MSEKRHYKRRQPRERKPRIPAADYKPWSEREQKYLTQLVEAGNDNTYIAKKLVRPIGDVTAEIKRLGIESKYYEPDPLETPPKERICLKCDRVFYDRSERICPNCKRLVEFQGEDMFFRTQRLPNAAR